ncbi:MAG: metal-dependent hydrolase [Anaerolinea sp.]|nr:metal-dependent hydrolase [Anaerolinea sp.]
MAIRITWLGHSAFALDIDGHPILIDPFVTGNPLAPFPVADLKAEFILVSHGHGDHVGDAVELANRTGAATISNVEISAWLRNKGVETAHGQNSGGSCDYGGFMRVKLTQAFHSSSLPDGSYGGMPNGFVISAAGQHLYFAGDTALFSDMSLIGDEGIDVAFLPIGDYFTMGVADSLRAINFIRPRFVLPMHYNTIPQIAADVSMWGNRVSSETGAQPIVLDPGGSYTLHT